MSLAGARSTIWPVSVTPCVAPSHRALTPGRVSCPSETSAQNLPRVLSKLWFSSRITITCLIGWFPLTEGTTTLEAADAGPVPAPLVAETAKV
jgi:hypothetical protein